MDDDLKQNNKTQNKRNKTISINDDPDLKNNDLQSDLMVACKEGYFKDVKLLLDQGAKIDDQNFCNETALMIACRRGRIKIVRFLLEKGASVNICYNKDWNGVLDAHAYGHIDVFNYYFKKALSNPDNDKQTALMIACKEGHFEIVKLLLEKEANVNHQSNYGWTALMLACEKGNIKIVKLLLEKKAQINLKNIEKSTALMIACEKNHMEIVKLLIPKKIIYDLSSFS